MSREKSLHVFLPGFCGPLADPAELVRHEHAVGILRSWLDRLARGRKRNVRLKYHLNLYRLLGFSLDAVSSVPTAAFRLLASEQPPEIDRNGNFMHADPVHLQADMDHAIMTSPAALDLLEQHAAELLQSLNVAFADDDIRFFKLDTAEWFVTTPGSIDLHTTPLDDAVGRNVNHLLPYGEQAVYWKRLLTEVQMLLFDHEVNSQREARGLPAINSLWFHGNGTLPARSEHTTRYVISDDPVVLGMAAYAGVESSHCERTSQQSAKKCFDKIISTIGEGPDGDYVVKLSSLQDLVNYTDVRPWLDQVNVLVENWLEPLLAFAHQEKVTFRFYPDNDYIYQIGKYDGLRVWKAAQLFDFIDSFGPAS